MEAVVNPGFWRGRRVLVTGHTGFKGAWLCLMLAALGAEVQGLALPPERGPGAFRLLGIKPLLAADLTVDLRQGEALAEAMAALKPEIVLHLAVQAFVGRGYRDPAGTFAVNLGGTIKLLQALRDRGAAACVVVTSDKVYRNDASGRAFVEEDALGGHDPYSASKAACEIAVASWRASFADLPPLATARAGNVIGGGDFGEARLVPDLVRAQQQGVALKVRRPDATRPFQHVLDVLRGYLLLAEATAEGRAPPALNFGPRDGALRVRDLLALWGDVTWEQEAGAVIAEAPLLGLDASLAQRTLGWAPRFTTPQAVAETARWYALWREGGDVAAAARAAVEAAL